MDSSSPGDHANPSLTWVTCALIAALAFAYVFITFRGLNSPAAMDQAQVARELARGHGFHTQMVRPAAFQAAQASGKDASITAVQDTYNPPLQALLWAPMFKLVPSWWPFDVTRGTVYVLDRLIAGQGVFWFLLTLLLTHGMARRLFDRTIASLTVLAVAVSPPMWELATTSGPRALLLFLFTLAMYWLTMLVRRAHAAEPVGFGLLLGIGLACGLMVMTHWMAVWLVLGIAVAIAVLAPGQRHSLVVVLTVPLLFMAGWALHNRAVSGTLMGTGKVTIRSLLSPFTEQSHLRDFSDIAPPVNLDLLLRKINGNINWQMQDLFSELAGVIPALVFFLCLLHRFRRPEVQSMRWVLVIVWACAWLGMSMLGLPGKVEDDNQVHIIFVPVLTMFGLAALSVFWARLYPGKKNLWALHGHAVIAIVLTGWPMLARLPSDLRAGLFMKNQLMNWPPYRPITISFLNKWVAPQEVLASDSPWCVSWYADRTCLWLPKDREQFDKIREISDKQGHHVAGLVITPLATADNVGGIPFSGAYGAWADWTTRGTALGLSSSFDLAGAVKYLQAFPVHQSLGSVPLADGRTVPCIVFYTDKSSRLGTKPP